MTPWHTRRPTLFPALPCLPCRSSPTAGACAQRSARAAGLLAVRAGWLPDPDPSAWRAWIKGRPNFHRAKWLHEGTSCFDVSTSRTNSRIWLGTPALQQADRALFAVAEPGPKAT